MAEIEQIGFVDKGTGKHQSNAVYFWGGAGSHADNRAVQVRPDDSKFSLCNRYAYCIDANYSKGISFEEFIRKHRRQLVIETYG